jgi:hypothetical protein
VFERQDSILHCIKWSIKIVRSGDLGRHLLGLFDVGGGGWVCLEVRQMGECLGGHGEC